MLPHVPQLLTSVCVLVSQPSVRALLLQSAKPGWQWAAQSPPAQVGDVWLLLQATPHPPQLATSVAVLISQPSVCALLLQSAKPDWQLAAQRLAAQEGFVWLLLHTTPHAPQLVASLWTFVVQPIPAQLAKPGMHALVMHVPPLQD
jgi:hypothetical protein